MCGYVFISFFLYILACVVVSFVFVRLFMGAWALRDDSIYECVFREEFAFLYLSLYECVFLYVFLYE